MKFGSLFAGIGGFDLGLERAGMECRWQVEKDPFCNRVLAKHWPGVKRYEDIRDVESPESVDLICGGFPCQPFSCAGKRRGAGDDRFLWPEMLRVIRAVHPAWVIGENVAGIINMALDGVLADLENAGYACETFIVPACAVDAPHRRDRVWVVAHFASERLEKREGFGEDGVEKQPAVERSRDDVSNACERRCGGSKEREIQFEGRTEVVCTGQDVAAATGGIRRDVRGSWSPKNVERHGSGIRAWKPEPGVGRVANGVPGRVDRLRSLGNAVVPQVVQVIGEAIMHIETNLTRKGTT